jgi:predicted nucleic acid-binding protein
VTAPSQGLLDTCTVIDLARLDPAKLPDEAAISAVTLAELAQGVAMARTPVDVMARSQLLADAQMRFEALPFDAEAARRYGTLVAMVVAVGRSPRPRRMDLMIAAVASTANLPLYTRNAADFRGLDGAVTVKAV